MASVVIHRVQPDICFGKGTEVGHRRAWSHPGAAHLKRHQCGIGHAVGENVRSGTSRKEVGDVGRPHRPVHERQFTPVLVEQNGAG